MSDDNLPQEVEEAIENFADAASESSFNDNCPMTEEAQMARYNAQRDKAKRLAVLAITRARAQREAETIERCAKVCDRIKVAWEHIAFDEKREEPAARARTASACAIEIRELLGRSVP